MKKVLNLVLLAAVLVAAAPAPLWAQDMVPDAVVSDEPAEPADTIPTLTSVGSVIAVTILLVQLLKKSVVPTWPAFGSVPIPVYTMAIAAVLTVVANQVFKTLPGELWPLVWDAVRSAAMASGIFEWKRAISKPIAETSEAVRLKV